MTDWLRKNLIEVFKLSSEATEWLLMMYASVQVFDDIADGQQVERKNLNAAIWNTLVGMNENLFFKTNSKTLTPIVALAILKWQASDKEEKAGNADAMCFAWRAGYYDLVLAAILLEHGTAYALENSNLVMRLYGEKFNEYITEFNHA